MPQSDHTIVWLEHAGQRLGLLPTLGGGVAAWQIAAPSGRLDLWRPWDGARPDRYTLASFPLVPWSNRISGGGFEHDGRFHPIQPNRVGEPYPIHGDGWLQAWSCEQPAADTMVMRLRSSRFDGNPYEYAAEQRFTLRPDGMDQSLRVTHLGEASLPYGLGQHPYFLRDEDTRLAAPVKGVWLSGKDPLPTEHSTAFPPGWDLRDTGGHGPFIDNAYTGWSGEARIVSPRRGLRLSMRVPQVADAGADGYCLIYRPAQGDSFCFEPITHPIDSFHAPDRAGLRVLRQGEELRLDVQWRVELGVS
jgi:aldose 1-epimerase